MGYILDERLHSDFEGLGIYIDQHVKGEWRPKYKNISVDWPEESRFTITQIKQICKWLLKNATELNDAYDPKGNPKDITPALTLPYSKGGTDRCLNK